MVKRVKVDGYTYNQPSNVELEFTKYVDSETNIATPIIENLEYVTLTVVPEPADANIVLTAEGYQQEGNSITVLSGTEVFYTISANHYNTAEDSYIVENTETLTVSLVPLNYTLTIVPTPADSTVVLTAEGYSQVGNHITVPYGTDVLYSVSKLAYNTARGLITIKDTMTLGVHLVKAGNAAKFMNYGTCVVCFQTQGVRVFDLGSVSEQPSEAYDYGTNLITGEFDEFIDCGGLDA